MPSVYQVARTFRAELLAGDDAAKRQMLDAYLAAWKVLEPQLVQVTRLIADARRSGEDVSPAWLYRQSRYRDLLQQVGAEVSRLASALGPLVTNRQASLVRLAEDHARELLRAGKTQPPGIVAGFNRINPEAVLQIIGQFADGSPLVDRLRLYGPAAVEDVRAAFTRGVILGESIPDMTRRVRRAARDMPAFRAVTLVRTESLRAFREASRLSYEANSDIVRGWVWLSARDRRVDAFCWAMDGTFHPVSARMATHPRCFPAGTVVSGPRAVASTSRWYAGELVRIETSGRDLSVTPNHPVLTARGWVAAGLIREGDDLICQAGAQSVVSVHPNQQHPPTPIEQVVESVGSTLGVPPTSVPTTAKDFHGDGIDGEVCVVRADGLLLDGGDASVFEPVPEQFFGRGDVGEPFFPQSRQVTQVLERHAPASHGGVRRSGVIAPLFRGAGLLNEDVGFMRCAWGDATTNEEARESGATYAAPLSQDIDRYAGGVLAEKVISVRRYPFSHLVYSLETPEGWYIANGVIVHNCRCTMVPWVKGEPNPLPRTGPELFEGLPAEQQRRAFGTQEKYRAYAGGAITLKDIPGFARTRQWGRTGYERSLTEIVGAEEALAWRRVA